MHHHGEWRFSGSCWSSNASPYTGLTPTNRQPKRNQTSARRRYFGLELGLGRIYRAPRYPEFAEGGASYWTLSD